MPVRFSQRRTAVSIHQQFRIIARVSVSLLQSSRAGQQATLAVSECRRNDGERRKMQQPFNFFGGVDRIVEIFQQQRKTNSQSQGEEQGNKNCARAIWSDGTLRGDGVIDNRDVVWLAGHDYVVFLGTLQQIVQQRFVSLNFLLNDPVVNRSFVLGQRFSTLFFKRLAQLLFARQRLPVTRFQISQNRTALAQAHFFGLPIKLRYLLIDLFNFRRFLGSVDHQLRSLLAQVRKFGFSLVYLFSVEIGEGVGRASDPGGVIFGFGFDAFILRLEQLLIETGKPFGHGILIGLERDYLIVFCVVDELLFISANFLLQLCNTLFQKLGGTGVRFTLLLEVVEDIRFGDGVDDARSYLGVSVGISDVDQTRLFVQAAGFFYRVHFQTSKNSANIRSKTFGLGKILMSSGNGSGSAKL